MIHKHAITLFVSFWAIIATITAIVFGSALGDNPAHEVIVRIAETQVAPTSFTPQPTLDNAPVLAVEHFIDAINAKDCNEVWRLTWQPGELNAQADIDYFCEGYQPETITAQTLVMSESTSETAIVYARITMIGREYVIRYELMKINGEWTISAFRTE